MDVKEIVIKDYEKFAKITNESSQMLDIVEEVIKNWIEEGENLDQLLESLTVLLGQEAGRLVYNVLTLPTAVVMEIFKICENVGENQALLTLKKLAALYSSEVRKYKNTKIMVNNGSLTIEKGRFKISLDDDDLKLIINAVLEHKPAILDELLPNIEPENKYHA